MNTSLAFTKLTYLLYVLEKNKIDTNPKKRLRCLLLKTIASSKLDSETLYNLIDAGVFSGNKRFKTSELQHKIGKGTIGLDDRYIPLSKVETITKLCSPKTLEDYKFFMNPNSKEWSNMSYPKRKEIVNKREDYVKSRKSSEAEKCKEAVERFMSDSNSFKYAIEELLKICPNMYGSAFDIIKLNPDEIDKTIMNRLIDLDGDIFLPFKQMQAWNLDISIILLTGIRDWIRIRQRNETVDNIKSIYGCYYQR